MSTARDQKGASSARGGGGASRSTGQGTSGSPRGASQSAERGAGRTNSRATRGDDEASRPTESLAEVRFLTVAEVAAVMRVSKMTVYRMVHGGDLPAVRVGRSFRVPEKAVHDYLRAAFIEAG